jgi:predicted AlkP superfamily pyrophosphatase or phosphodiesterase
MKKPAVFLLLILCAFQLNAQTLSRPKLVVGIVVDQMRWDFLYRYDRYSNDGFKRMLREGFSCENTFIPYTPTYTACGHTCIYTGSVPSLHGIIGNNWFDRPSGKIVYCTDDSSVSGVGSSSIWGKMSPRNLWSNTITDELRVNTNFKNKTIAIALKDRSSILPGGHTANAAYWFDNTAGGFISSTFYLSTLPNWLLQFNSKKLPDTYLNKNWNTLFPLNTYVQSTEDNKIYEDAIPGEDNVFEHETAGIINNKYESFRYSPYANTYTLDMAKAAIEGEALGKRGVTDFLTISFSSTDYIGHKFGPNSVEIEDTYLRLDRDLGQFFKYLDATIGKGQYLVFLTADHGVAHVPGFEKENKLPAGSIDDLEIARILRDSAKAAFGVEDLVSAVINYQVYLNENSLKRNKLDKKMVSDFLVAVLIQQPSIAKAFALETTSTVTLPEKLKTMIINGYNQKLSGDIQFVFKPQWIDWAGAKGTSHGNWGPYDSHIPLIWFGWNVKPGKLYREVYMTDIAVTLAASLHIQMPNAAVGKVIEEVVK